MSDLNKVYEMCVGLDDHLRRIYAVAEQIEQVKVLLENILRSQEQKNSWELQQLRKELGLMNKELSKRGLPTANIYECQLDDIKSLVNNPSWPVAVNPNEICQSLESIHRRSNGILDIFVAETMRDKKFLDFGCGTGHVAQAAAEKGAIRSVGYDIHNEKIQVKPSSNLALTSSFEEVRNNSPYDIILLFDVLDHIEAISPIEALMQIRSLLAPNGKVFIQNHPWSSRHGGHLYEQVNKAYLHLILDEVELTRLGGWSCEYNVKVVTPLETYRHWIQEAGFATVSEFPARCDVEEFFFNTSIKERVLKNFASDIQAKDNMGISFVQYVLETNKQPRIF